MLIVYLLASFITSFIMLIAIRGLEPVARLYDIKEYADIESRRLRFIIYILLIINHITTPFLATYYWIYKLFTRRKK